MVPLAGRVERCGVMRSELTGKENGTSSDDSNVLYLIRIWVIHLYPFVKNQ